MSLALSACRHLSYHSFFSLLLSLHKYKGTRHISSNFLPSWFSISGKLTALLFNNLLIPGYQTKKLRDVMATYFQNRRQKVFNRGALRFCGRKLWVCAGGAGHSKIDKSTTDL